MFAPQNNMNIQLKSARVVLEACFWSTIEWFESCFQDYYLMNDFIQSNYKEANKQLQTPLPHPCHSFPQQSCHGKWFIHLSSTGHNYI